MSFSSLSDAYNATQRLYAVFEAETLEETRIIEDTLDVAIEVKGATFTWDAPPPEVTAGKKGKKNKKPPTSSQEITSVEPFRMRDVSLTVPRGQLVAIVGQVGTGKSSLLQGIIGEMRRTSGTVKFGGSVGYCPQTAWIQVSKSRWLLFTL
jgi:ABC-type transport system involved in cytochrome bd biosynthesis fused ATPase/permease subunit